MADWSQLTEGEKRDLACEQKFFQVHTVDLLVYFDHTVDLPNKPKAGQESDCACKKNIESNI